jgi:hypothetical protein
MIEIRCTKEQKQRIIQTIFDCDDYCIFDHCKENFTCMDCLNKRIKWEIVNENS